MSRPWKPVRGGIQQPPQGLRDAVLQLVYDPTAAFHASRTGSPIVERVRAWCRGEGCSRAQWENLVALVMGPHTERLTRHRPTRPSALWTGPTKEM